MDGIFRLSNILNTRLEQGIGVGDNEFKIGKEA